MKRSWWLAFALLATMLGLAHGSRGWAKPPDNDIRCSELEDEPVKGRFSIELGITPKGVTLKFGAGLAMPEPPAVIDAICPTIVPAYVQTLIDRLKSGLGRLALDRIGELDDRLREAEESSETDPETLFDRMRERTIPLGLVQQVTY